MTKGLRDAFIIPWSSLVLDDTPGAFFAGVSSGLSSLLYNVADATLTTLLRVINVVSWLTLQLTFDDEFQQAKRRMRRAHPPNVWWGIAQGSRELARGVWTGLTGLLTQPWRGARSHGCLGCLTGVAKGAAGLPSAPRRRVRLPRQDHRGPPPASWAPATPPSDAYANPTRPSSNSPTHRSSPSRTG